MIYIRLVLAFFLLSLTVVTVQAEQQKNYHMSWNEAQQQFVGESLERTWVPMRDGVRLDTNIYLPKGKGPYPTVLIRSPYPMDPILEMRSQGGFMLGGILPMLLDNDYAVVFQNERGRFWSEGDYQYLANAREDGYDTVEWLSKQRWSNGKIGTFGCSSHAENQLALSAANHPAHMAAVAEGPGAGIGVVGPYAERGNHYRGGALQLLFASWNHDFVVTGASGARLRPQFPSDLTREERIKVSKVFSLRPTWQFGAGPEGMDYEAYFNHLPVSDLNLARDDSLGTPWEDFSRMGPMDPGWKDVHMTSEGDSFGTPMLWMFSWYDVGVAPNVALYNYARENTASKRAKDNQFMVIAPGVHCSFGTETENTVVGERELGDARSDYHKLYLEWFDYWLKGDRNKVWKNPRVRYYQMGENRWVTSNQFPLKGTEMVELFLDSQGSANSRSGDGVLSFDAPPAEDNSDGFVYDPMHPVPTLGGGACCQGNAVHPGAYDQAELEIRDDVLVYTTQALEEDLVVAGFIEVELYVSSSAKDTDFTVKLVDVEPDGRAFNLDDNIMRVRYREGYDKTVLMEDGEVYKVVFAPMVTANTFKAGHRIRLEVSSSNFPRYDRNLNTGGNNFDEAEPVIAKNRVHHSTVYPSVLRLPVNKLAK